MVPITNQHDETQMLGMGRKKMMKLSTMDFKQRVIYDQRKRCRTRLLGLSRVAEPLFPHLW